MTATENFTPRQVLESMGSWAQNKNFERRENSWRDEAFWNPAANLTAYNFFAGNENKHAQYSNAKFPLQSHGMYITHLLVTTNFNFKVSDPKNQAQYFQYFLEHSQLSFKIEHTDLGDFFLRDLYARTFEHSAPSSATTYLTGRDNMLNYYPLQVPFIVGAGKELKCTFIPAEGLVFADYSATLTPYLPENPKTGGELSTSDAGYSMTVWMKGYKYSEAKA